MDDRTPRPGRAKVVGLSVAALAVALFAWQTYETIASRPTIVRQPARAAMETFGIARTNVPAPDIELAALDGTRFSLESARGEVVFVNFWATWCPPCIEELPSMVRLAQDLTARHPGKFRMVAVSVDEELADVKKYFEAPPFSGAPSVLTVAHDADQAVTQAYYCAARGSCPDLKFPETYIVDKAGRLVGYIVGARDWAHPAARAFLEELIGS
jgi:thiol-disulfide isomerase/thioredoxin